MDAIKVMGLSVARFLLEHRLGNQLYPVIIIGTTMRQERTSLMMHVNWSFDPMTGKNTNHHLRLVKVVGKLELVKCGFLKYGIRPCLISL